MTRKVFINYMYANIIFTIVIIYFSRPMIITNTRIMPFFFNWSYFIFF